MAGWTRHAGTLVHLPRDNVDTDQILPARFMSVPRSDGYGDYLMHDVRREGDTPDPDFPLNAVPGASILVAGRNFGSGSSREAAVYALVDAGFRAVLAPSFGDIFAANAVNNGLCPARLPEGELARLAACAEGRIDIAAREIVCGDIVVGFEIEDSWATKLIEGWDDIDLTLRHNEAIETYRTARLGLGWVTPSG